MFLRYLESAPIFRNEPASVPSPAFKIIPVNDVNTALSLKKEGYVLFGENNLNPIEGFQYGNSPTQTMNTSAGITGPLAPLFITELLAGGIIDYSIYVVVSSIASILGL